MSLIKFFKSRVFLKHLILAFILITVIITITLLRLKSYTHHGESFPVPDFSGLAVNEIEALANQHDLKYEIIDSIHFDGAAPGVVVEQIPEAGFNVKRNRIVFLTINSTVPEKVILPKLTDISFRQAQALIENCGIVLGTITYQPSEYNSLVLKAEQNSREIKEGDIILKGSTVDLVIGSNSGNLDAPLPDLTGKTFSEAQSVLASGMLNTGVLICDETILSSEDTLRAIIWKQYPNYKNTRIVSVGTSIDLWLTLDSLKIQPPTIQVIE